MEALDERIDEEAKRADQEARRAHGRIADLEREDLLGGLGPPLGDRHEPGVLLPGLLNGLVGQGLQGPASRGASELSARVEGASPLSGAAPAHQEELAGQHDALAQPARHRDDLGIVQVRARLRPSGIAHCPPSPGVHLVRPVTAQIVRLGVALVAFVDLVEVIEVIEVGNSGLVEQRHDRWAGDADDVLDCLAHALAQDAGELRLALA